MNITNIEHISKAIKVLLKTNLKRSSLHIYSIKNKDDTEIVELYERLSKHISKECEMLAEKYKQKLIEEVNKQGLNMEDVL